MLQRFDKNADGKISPEEATAAKAAMQTQWQQGPRRGDGGGPRPRGGRASDQPPAGQPAPAAGPKPNP